MPALWFREIPSVLNYILKLHHAIQHCSELEAVPKETYDGASYPKLLNISSKIYLLTTIFDLLNQKNFSYILLL